MFHLEEPHICIPQLGNKVHTFKQPNGPSLCAGTLANGLSRPNIHTPFSRPIFMLSFPLVPHLQSYELYHKCVIVHMKLTDVSEEHAGDLGDGGSSPETSVNACWTTRGHISQRGGFIALL